jgi:glucose-6-phosphate 1-dehydrogenase
MTNSLSHTIHTDDKNHSIIDVGTCSTVREVPPCIVTIFGATGDLTNRKLLPALYDLAAQKLLPEKFVIVGYGRREKDEAQFREELKGGVQKFARLKFKPEVWEKLSSKLFYQRGAYDEVESHQALEERLTELDTQFNIGGNRMYYLATPPEEFAPVIENLGALRKKRKDGGWRRLIVEKPFGRDLKTARELNELLAANFPENDVFRIDHYLGKETVQNILALRFANTIWEPLWNNHYIDHVQIVVSEEVGVGRRGGYYETSGALRDMVVNHMLQLLSLVAMEPPVALESNAIRDEKVKVLRAIREMNGPQVLQNTLRGQYDGYHQEEGVDPSSRTETYVAMKLMVDSWRWSGVPFYLRHGKAMTKRATEIVVRWKDAPYVLFNDQVNRVKSNLFVMRIQPNEGFALRANAKVPGSGMEIHDVQMDFDYNEAFGAEPPEAYERLLQDAMLGDGTLFTRRDEAEVAWSIVDPVLEAWRHAPMPFSYPQGSWGPDEADEFMSNDKRRWHQPQVLPAKNGEANPDSKASESKSAQNGKATSKESSNAKSESIAK